MLKRTILGLSLALIVGFTASAQPKVEFSGFLDADVWTDLEGSLYTNHELDLGMGIGFTDNVAAHVYVTMTAGSVPAGIGSPDERWGDVAFDGVDIEISSDFGTFTVGDLVYQYGGFNYYLYKRLSMITAESFTRGIQYSIGSDVFTQSVLIGSADAPSVFDAGGVSALTFGEGLGLSLMYGTRVNVYDGYEGSGTIYAGAEFLGTFGEALALKADVGFQNFTYDVLDTAMMPTDTEKGNLISLLIEPALTLGKFSTAATFFTLLDLDETGEGIGIFGINDEMLVYVEPGYAFTDMLAAGLPIEYHAGILDDENDDEFWLVPTFYVLPTDGVQWWIWAQAAFPTAEGSDPYFGLGSELIVEF